MKKFCCLTFLLSMLLFPCFSAVEVVSILRDFSYEDIFTYKPKIVGEARINKFDFPNCYEDDAILPEYFQAKIKADKDYQGKMVKVIFAFKSGNNTEYKKITRDVLLKGSSTQVRFEMSSAEIKKNGRVNAWEISVYEGTKKLGTHRSQNKI